MTARVAVIGLVLLTGCAKPPAYDRFGGYTGIEREAAGHFRVEQVDGRWMFITPEGHGYVALGANHVGKFLDHPEQPRELLARLGGDRAAAEDAMHQAMLDLGLNAGEAYAPLLPSLTRRMPYVVNIDFPAKDKFRFDVFDPEFMTKLDEHVQAECGKVADDPMVLGIAFADLPVWNERRIEYFQSLPGGAPGRERYEESADDEEFLGLVAETLYAQLRQSVRAAAPGKLFFGERFVLRMAPEPVLRAVGRHVDVFCTQALILSPQRPPEWQVFQKEGYDRDRELTNNKPMIVIDWAAPFSLDETYETERGVIKNEEEASREAAEWLESVFSLPYVIGVFKCQLIGSHGNDRWFPEGRMKRTYLRDDGLPFDVRTPVTKHAHERVLASVYGF